jgi:positive regulator of sigma E activity
MCAARLRATGNHCSGTHMCGVMGGGAIGEEGQKPITLSTSLAVDKGQVVVLNLL